MTGGGAPAPAPPPERARGCGHAAANWALAALAAGAFSIAIVVLLSGVAPKSDCGTPQAVHWHIAAFPFLLFVAAGGYVFAWGGAAVRLLLFAWMCLVLVAFVTGLSLSLPIVHDTGKSCARQGAR